MGSGACASSGPRPPGASLTKFQPLLRRQQLSLATFSSLGQKSPNPLFPSSSRSPSSTFPKRHHPHPARAAESNGGLPGRRGEGRRRSPLPPSAVTYTASISTDLPLYEPPWAPFDDYLADRPRVFRAMFPDKRRSQRLNDEEWSIRMLPIQFLLVSVNPIVVMRLRTNPASGVKRVLELQATRWELQGLDRVHMPPHFELDVRGSLYSDRRGGGAGRSRLMGHLEMSISLVLPSVFSLVPGEVLRSVAESVLKRLVGRMKQEVDVNLLADYRNFSKEMMAKRQQQVPSSKERV